MATSGTRSLRAGVTVVAVALALGSCHKRPRLAHIPLPPPKTVAKLDPMENVPDPPQPEVSLPIAATELAIFSAPADLPPPPAPRLSRPRRARPFVGPIQEPGPAQETASPVAPQPAPQLEQLLSSGDQRRLNQAIDHNLQNARHDVAVVHTRKLNAAQRTTLSQVEDFIRQARQLRQTDLLEAANLSRKAAVLARDLVASVK